MGRKPPGTARKRANAAPTPVKRRGRYFIPWLTLENPDTGMVYDTRVLNQMAMSGIRLSRVVGSTSKHFQNAGKLRAYREALTRLCQDAMNFCVDSLYRDGYVVAHVSSLTVDKTPETPSN